MRAANLWSVHCRRVLKIGMFCHVWGHAITDNLKFVWFLKSNDFKIQFKDCPTVYIPFGNRFLNENESLRNFKRLLEILEVDVEEIRPITQATRFDKIILPEESFSASKGFTNEYRETINFLRDFALKNRTPISSKKIYYFYGRNQVGEERLAEYFKSKGYEIFRPEKLTLDEQLNLLINAESFASTLGSCSHNSIFLRDKTEMISILRSHDAFKKYQQIINQVHPLNFNYVDSTFSIFNTRHNSFCFIISKQLKRFFGDKWDGYDEEDFKAFLKYVKVFTGKGFSANPKELDGYGLVLTDFIEQLKKREDLIVACDMPPNWEGFRPLLTYQTHVHVNGWKDGWKDENQISNDIKQKRDIQAIKINFPSHKIYYSVYFNEEEGWSKEVLAPEMAGTTGKKKSIMGIRIRLDEAGSKEFDILYRVHKFDGTWTDWAKNGEALLSNGVKLNAIQIKLEPKN